LIQGGVGGWGDPAASSSEHRVTCELGVLGKTWRFQQLMHKLGCSPWASPSWQPLLSSRPCSQLLGAFEAPLPSQAEQPELLILPGSGDTAMEGCCHQGGPVWLHPRGWTQTCGSFALCRSWGGFLGVAGPKSHPWCSSMFLGCI